MSDWVDRHISCPKCDSSDGYSTSARKDGSIQGKCFSCGYYTPLGEPGSLNPQDVYGVKQKHQRESLFRMSTLTIEEIQELPVRAVPDRFIDVETASHFDLRVALSQVDGVTPTSYFIPHYRKGKLVAYKERVASQKQFLFHGTAKELDLFGQNVCNPNGGKTLYITEGEFDCLSVYQTLKNISQLNDWKPNVVSLPTGAASAASSIASNLSFVDSFDKVVLIFDNDEAGERAVQDVCRILAGKVHVVTLPMKDANEMLVAKRESDLYWAIQSKAVKFKSDGIINGADTWDRFRHGSNHTCYPYPSEWVELNKKTFGCRPGSIVTCTSGSGAGKSTFMNELKYHFFKTTEHRIADITLEQDLGDTVGDMLSLHLNKRLKLPNVQSTEEELKEAHNFLFSDDRWMFYDHFGGMDDDSLFSKLREFAASGCKFIFLDHLSIIISEFAVHGSERERIDTIMTKLAKFVKQWNVTVFLVVHLRKTNEYGKSFEQGVVPSLDDLRGSGSLKQLSWEVLGLSRNQQHSDEQCANTSQITVLKNRFTGNTGVADYLYFDKITGRMSVVPKPMGYDMKVKFSAGNEE